MNSEGGLILIVEDEKGIRESTAEYLRALNYRVLEAANGFEALEMTANDSSRPDLVVTDVVMPGMTGPEMAQRLRLRWPDLKFIFMTGYTEEPLLRHGEFLKSTLLKKPFNLRLLGGKIQEALSAAPS